MRLDRLAQPLERVGEVILCELHLNQVAPRRSRRAVECAERLGELGLGAHGTAHAAAPAPACAYAEGLGEGGKVPRVHVVVVVVRRAFVDQPLDACARTERVTAGG